jgi:hypothetical protein
VVTISRSQALAWRLGRHFLDPVGTASVVEVVGRLCALPATPEESAELAVRLRRARSRLGEVTRALADGGIIRTFAFRGAVHLMTPEAARSILALRGASRMWELPSWVSYYGVTPEDWPGLRDVVRAALADGPLTRSELGAAVTAHARFAHLAFAFADDAGTFLKPLCWQGVMSFGPSRDERGTFQALDSTPRWQGLMELEEAGPRAVEAYLRAYGPATAANVHHWLTDGLGAGRRRVTSWLGGLGDRVATVEIEGDVAHVMREDLDELHATAPTDALRFLPAVDQWVMGPGSADRHIVPPARRSVVSRHAALVVAGGVVAGTWTLKGDEVAVGWFSEAGPAPRERLEREVARLGGILGRELSLEVATA